MYSVYSFRKNFFISLFIATMSMNIHWMDFTEFVELIFSFNISTTIAITTDCPYFQEKKINFH